MTTSRALSKLLGQPVTCFAKEHRLTTTISWPAFACPAHAACANASRISCGVVGQHQCFPGQGRGRKQWLYVRVQLAADLCGSVRAAKKALVGLHSPKCYTKLASSRLLDMMSQLTAMLGAPPWEECERGCSMYPSDKFLWEKYPGGSSHVTSCQSDSSLVGMS